MKTTNNHNVFFEDDIEISNAKLDGKLSYINFDSNSNTFYSTIDKVVFHNLSEIIERILESNAYTVNFENILSCLDSFKFAVKASTIKTSNSSEKPQAQSYLPCLTFQLPSRISKGYLLNSFYNEISVYEQALASSKSLAKKDTSSKEMKQIERENETLKRQVIALESKIKDLSQKLSILSANTENRSDFYLELGFGFSVATGSVRQLQLEQRNIVIKLGKKTVNYPLLKCNKVPLENEICLIVLKDSSISNILFVDPDKGHSLTLLSAAVVYTSKEVCKVRDQNRKIWVIRPQSDEEEKLILRTNIGDHFIISVFNNRLISFKESSKFNPIDLEMEIQENIILRQMEAQYAEAIIETYDKKKDEVA